MIGLHLLGGGFKLLVKGLLGVSLLFHLVPLVNNLLNHYLVLLSG
jgi:hypothetical protein